MITTLYLTPDGTLKQNLGEDELRAAVRSKQGLLWADFHKPTDDETFMLDDVFGFHPLSIEDCQHISQFPKLDDFGAYLFLVFLAPNPAFVAGEPPAPNSGNGGNGDPVRELDIFLGANYVVTYRITPLPFIQELVDRARKNPRRLLGRAPAFLLHEILDHAVDQFFAIVDKFQEEAEEAEVKLGSEGTLELLSSVLEQKRRVLRLRRQMSDHREVVQRMVRGGNPLLAPEAQPYFRDILDHLNKIEADLEVCRDTIDNARDAFLALADVRINQVMKVLTVVFTLSLPLTVMTSWFGMNFEILPLAKHEIGVWIYTVIMFAVVVLMAVWLWWKKLL